MERAVFPARRQKELARPVEGYSLRFIGRGEALNCFAACDLEDVDGVVFEFGNGKPLVIWVYGEVIDPAGDVRKADRSFERKHVDAVLCRGAAGHAGEESCDHCGPDHGRAQALRAAARTLSAFAQLMAAMNAST